MTNAFIQCQGHMYPAIDSYCKICREKERIARIASSDHIGESNKLIVTNQ
jgi:hypothetical protein